MTALKNNEAIGVLGKVETTYNTPATLAAATDGIQIIKPRPLLSADYLFEGARPSNGPGSYGPLQRPAPNGRFVAETLRIEPKGFGAAYSASNKVPHLSALMRAAGFVETVVTTPGSESVAYTPNVPTDVPSSMTLGIYTENELHTLAGVYCDLTMLLNDGGIPVFEFAFMGTMATDPTETPLPTGAGAIAYHNPAIVPPTASAINFVVGNYLAAIVRTVTFKMGRSIQNPRRNLNLAALHAGFTPGAFSPVLTFTLEATALQATPFHNVNGLDPYQLRKAATSLACSFKVGGTQYNRWGPTFPNGIQITSIKQNNDGPTAAWDFEAVPYCSTPNLADFVSIKWD